MTRLALIADLHGLLIDPGSLPDADALLIAGDMVPRGATPAMPMLDEQRAWVREQLAPWVERVSRRMPVVAICGNGDALSSWPWGERELRRLAWTYLHDQTIRLPGGLRIHGSPWSMYDPTRPAPDGAFQQHDERLAIRWKTLACDFDVLLVHGPPYGARDEVSGRHFGSPSLARWLDRQQELGRRPLVVCGHVHEQPGFDAGVANASIGTPYPERQRSRMLVLDDEAGAWRSTWHRLPGAGRRAPLLRSREDFVRRVRRELPSP